MTDPDHATLARTPLDALHRSLGARMVPFAGHALPVQYPAGILAEHTHTRTHASLFDVSHMGQIRLAGDDAAAALEALVPSDIAGLAEGRQRYAFFTNAAGGIIDDLMVARLDGQLLLIVNGARRDHDLAHLRASVGARCQVVPRFDRALLALQGPLACDAMRTLAPAVCDLEFMAAARTTWNDIDLVISRSGYTGEDGFEIAMDGAYAQSVAEYLLAVPGVKPAGLGARDSLRLEAGLCLYGHDIDETVNPVEAALEWAIQKVRRRGGMRAGGFPGEAVILDALDHGPGRRRVGIRPDGRAPLREGEVLRDDAGNEVGRLTSGGFGATINGPVAMALVDTAHSAAGRILTATARNQQRACMVVNLPFVPHRYFRRTVR